MTPVLATYNLGDALLTMLSLFFLIIWVWILITILIDVFRDHGLSGWWKAVWLLFLVFVPVITALVYLIARGGGMRDRAIEHQAAAQKAADQYIRTVASSPADELTKLADLRAKGVISPEEYERMKAKVVA
jgi:ABC-type transport system involved in cytochrome bd biosynthesis fused ATPase/permease subunit